MDMDDLIKEIQFIILNYAFLLITEISRKTSRVFILEHPQSLYLRTPSKEAHVKPALFGVYENYVSNFRFVNPLSLNSWLKRLISCSFWRKKAEFWKKLAKMLAKDLDQTVKQHFYG